MNPNDLPDSYFMKVLDHGHVRLVSSMGDDLSIVRAARVSYNAAWRTGLDEGSDSKLLKFLWDNKHGTPFESVVFTFDIKLPIFVVRQWHRHRTWSYNELSARYRELPEEFYLPTPEHIGRQSGTNKQQRIMDVDRPLDREQLQKAMIEIQELREASMRSFNTYRSLLDQGWARELARTILPLNTYTHMFATVNLRNLFLFLHERLGARAQWEIKQYALALLELARQVSPEAVNHWELRYNGGGFR